MKRSLIMLYRVVAAAGAVALAVALQAQQPRQIQQPQQQQPAGPRAQMQEPPIVIYRIDLVPTGFAFAMNEPKLEGDVWVFRSLPDKTLERVPKARVKAITRKSTDFDKEVVWQVEVAGGGKHLVGKEPEKKGRNYLVVSWKNGVLFSIPESDVLKITRLTGKAAWRAEMEALGVVVLEGETTAAGFKHTADAPKSGPAAPGAPAPGSGNWTYQGTPGVSDAYAPGNATVARPGDTPMMPEPTRPPR